MLFHSCCRWDLYDVTLRPLLPVPQETSTPHSPFKTSRSPFSRSCTLNMGIRCSFISDSLLVSAGAWLPAEPHGAGLPKCSCPLFSPRHGGCGQPRAAWLGRGVAASGARRAFHTELQCPDGAWMKCPGSTGQLALCCWGPREALPGFGGLSCTGSDQTM